MTRGQEVKDGLCPGMTIEQILRDPMVRAVMRADHVDPEVFATLLRSVGRMCSRHTNTSRSRRRHSGSGA